MIYRGVSDGLAPPGIEFYLPLFFDTTDTLLDYLPKDTVVCAGADLPAAVDRAAKSIAERYEERRHDVERPVLAPDELYLAPEELQRAARRPSRASISKASRSKTKTQGPQLPDRRAAGMARGPARRAAARAAREFPRHVSRARAAGRGFGRTARSAARDAARAWAQAASRSRAGTSSSRATRASRCASRRRWPGLNILTPPIAVLGEAQLFGQRARQERRRRRAASDPQAILRDLTALGPGSPVVHEEYGVGRYLGLQVMQVAGQDGEFVVLEYAGGDKLYVPVQQLHLVSRYSGAAPESAPLHKLGTDQWAKARKRAADKIRDVAAELLDLYAQRQAKRGPALPSA